MLDRLGLTLAILFALANTAGILYYTERVKTSAPQIAVVDMQKVALSLIKIDPSQDEKTLNHALTRIKHRVVKLLEKESARTGKVFVSATSALAGLPDETDQVINKLNEKENEND